MSPDPAHAPEAQEEGHSGVPAHVWMYWEDVPGRVRPPYLGLCADTIRRQLAPGMTLHVLDEESVFDWLPDLDATAWKRLAVPAQRADYARTRLVYRHGGLWMDADCIAMRTLDELTGYVRDLDLASWGADVQGRFFNNLFVGRAGAPMLERWIESQDAVLASNDNWDRLPWAALGSDPVYPFLRDVSYANIPASKVAPVLWYGWRRFLSPFQSPAKVLATSPVTVMLWNKGMGPLLATRSAEELLGSKILLARLLRIALGTTTLDEELDAYTAMSRISDLRYRPVGRSAERRLRRLLGSGSPPARDPVGLSQPSP